MEMLTLKIPLTYIESKLGRPSWQDVQFGLKNQLMDPNAVSELADEHLESVDPRPEVIELAIAEPGESVVEEVDTLARREEPTPEATFHRWLYLVLAWLYDHRAELADPLQDVELVYADFDYPEELAAFVRYMPTNEPDLGDRAANEARMLGHWEHYLDRTQARLTAEPADRI